MVSVFLFSVVLIVSSWQTSCASCKTRQSIALLCSATPKILYIQLQGRMRFLISNTLIDSAPLPSNFQKLYVFPCLALHHPSLPVPARYSWWTAHPLVSYWQSGLERQRGREGKFSSENRMREGGIGWNECKSGKTVGPGTWGEGGVLPKRSERARERAREGASERGSERERIRRKKGGVSIFLEWRVCTRMRNRLHASSQGLYIPSGNFNL